MKQKKEMAHEVGLPKLYRAAVGALFFLILSVLFFGASFSTCYIAGREKIFFLPDSIGKNLAAMTVFFVLTFLVSRERHCQRLLKKINEEERLFLRFKLVLLLLHCALLCAWVICTRFPAGGDQITVLNAAYGLARRDFSSLSPVNYLYDYNHQVGLAMVELLLNRVVGEYNYAAYHTINAVLVTLILKNLSELGGLFGMSRVQQLCVIGAGMAFLPLSLYASFVYGTLPGLLLALLALKWLLRFFRGGSWLLALGAGMAMSVAVLFKQNYAIFMIGMVLYTMVELARSRKVKNLVPVLFLAVFYLVTAKLPLYCFAQMRGAEIPTGVSKWAWVTMGLQEGENPGWYNGYTLYTLIESNFDTQAQESWVKSDLKERLGELIEDPEYARSFFLKKILSQWNEPSFEAMHVQLDKVRDTAHPWVKAGISEQGNYRMTGLLDRYCFLLLGGALLFSLLCHGKAHYHEALLLPMILIGGFVFHIIWEAKGQYILPYYMLLLPVAVMGYGTLLQLLQQGVKAHVLFSALKKKKLCIITALLTVVLLLWVVYGGSMHELRSDATEYFAYLAETPGSCP